MAFKIAGSMAFKDAYQKAEPMLLEPIMELDVTVPDEAVGAVNGDLNSRRGRLLGMEPLGGMTTIKAEVPMAEVLTYSQSLTSLTGGRGDYAMSFLRYEEVPSHIAQKVMDDAAKAKEEASAPLMPGGAAPAVTCAICDRSLLVGERTERFSPDGARLRRRLPSLSRAGARGRAGTAKAGRASTSGPRSSDAASSPGSSRRRPLPSARRSPSRCSAVCRPRIRSSSRPRRSSTAAHTDDGRGPDPQPRHAASGDPPDRRSHGRRHGLLGHLVVPVRRRRRRAAARPADRTRVRSRRLEVAQTAWNAEVDPAGRLVPAVAPE